MSLRRCPICLAGVGPPLLVYDAVPASLNRLYFAAESARSAPSGRLEFAFCEDCEFGFNSAFDSALTPYDSRYENDQSHSSVFRAHLEQVVRLAVAARGERKGPVIEIGCGQGAFLRLLGSRLEENAPLVGLDPCYRSAGDSTKSMRFVRKRLNEIAPGDLPANPSLVYCRHVIEHVPYPVEFVREWTSGSFAPPHTPILIETPSLEWIAINGAFIDLVYEHCNYFSGPALRHVLTRAGCGVNAVERLFGGQYFVVTAQTQTHFLMQESQPKSSGKMLHDFACVAGERARHWRDRVSAAARRGPVAVWGGGAKGVSFASLLDPDCRLIRCVIDVNPQKQGRFIPLTGHPIVSPDEAHEQGIFAAIVMNPNYLEEIRAQITALRASIDLIPFDQSSG